SCGHAKDVLQKMSDAPLTDCPACGAAAFTKQLTAAGFQLKGSGWYVTDFRNGSSAPAPAAGKPADKPAETAASGTPAESSGTKSADSATTPSSKPEASGPSP